MKVDSYKLIENEKDNGDSYKQI